MGGHVLRSLYAICFEIGTSWGVCYVGTPPGGQELAGDPWEEKQRILDVCKPLGKLANPNVPNEFATGPSHTHIVGSKPLRADGLANIPSQRERLDYNKPRERLVRHSTTDR